MPLNTGPKKKGGKSYLKGAAFFLDYPLFLAFKNLFLTYFRF